MSSNPSSLHVAVAPPADIAEAIEASCARRGRFGTPLYYFPRIGSTNDLAARLASGGAPEGTTVVEPGDEVFFIAATENIRAVMKEMRRADKSVRRVMIGGGGNIGRRLAKAIEDRYDVKIIEYSRAGAEKLAAELRTTLVLVGDVTDEDLLQAENMGDMDVYAR